MKGVIFKNKILVLFVLMLLCLSIIPFTSPIAGATTTTTFVLTGAGDVTQLQHFGGSDTGTNWGNMNDPSEDNLVQNPTYGTTKYDLYTVTDPYQQGAISNVNVTTHWISWGVSSPGEVLKNVLKIDGSLYYSSVYHINGVYGTIGYNYTQWNTNPKTGGAWSWSNITSLQVGVYLDATVDNNGALYYQTINVTYTPSLTVTTNAATSVTTTTATLNGVAYGETGMTCGFNYNYSGGAKTNVTCAGTYDNGVAFTKDIVGLTANKKYTARAWANKAGVGFFNGTNNITFYTDVTKPVITINFAGNKSDAGGPYKRPPDETPTLSGVYANGYYTNNSYQKENWIYINLTVTDTGGMGVYKVFLHWYNQTANSWLNTTEFTRKGANYFEYNKTSIPQGKYSFDIYTVDNATNDARVWWNKTSPGGSYTRRYVSLDCTPININYTALYYNEDAFFSAGDMGKPDRLEKDQGTNAGTHDIGFLSMTTPTETINNIVCGQYISLWYNGDVCPQAFTVNNYYFHLWWSTDDNTGKNKFGPSKQEDYTTGIATEYFNNDNSTSRSQIYYDGLTSNDHYDLLTARCTATSPLTFTDNDIYNFLLTFKNLSAAFINPSFISNRSITSFILFNVPINATLNSTGTGDTDGDGLSDWTELYRTYTNPFLTDTDNDGVNDHIEYNFSYDPNNYTNTPSTLTLTPGIPTNVDSTNGGTSPLWLNITWIKGVNAKADNTIIRRSLTTQPLTPTDGTGVYNGTLSYFNDSIAQPYFYTLFSWNKTSNLYSIGVNLTDFYVVWVNAYNQSNGLNITDFTIFFSNPDGTNTLYLTNQNNPTLISSASCPQGEDISISCNATGYRTSSIVTDIVLEGIVYINFYLSPIEFPSEPGTEGENYTRQYRIHVINELNQPINNVYVEIKKYINTIGEYETIGSFYTNGYGDGDIWLLPSVSYKVFLTNDGFQDVSGINWNTDPVFYGANYPFIVKMYANPIIPQPPIIGDVTFIATLSTDETMIWANYSDISGFTDHTILTVSVFNYSTLSFQILGSYLNSSEQTWSMIFSGINRSNDYYFNLTVSHRYLGVFYIQRTIVAEIHPSTNITSFEDKFDWIGVIPFGAYNFFSWLFLVAVCYYADSRDAGKMIIVFGIICLFLGTYLGLTSPLTVSGGAVGGGIAVIFIVLGLLMEWNTSKIKR